MGQAYPIWQGQNKRLCHSMWLLHLHNTMKMQPFSPTFPLAESIAKAFCRLLLWNFKEKSINHFLGYSLSGKPKVSNAEPVLWKSGRPKRMENAPHNKNRLLVQAVFCLIHGNGRRFSYRQSTCDQTVTTVGQASRSLVRSL